MSEYTQEVIIIECINKRKKNISFCNVGFVNQNNKNETKFKLKIK